MGPEIAVSAIARQIELAIAPVFLLAGIGAILNVMAQRLARTVDRFRALMVDYRSLEGLERERAATELRLLDRRARTINWAITCCSGSALFVCLTVALMFIADPRQEFYARPLAVLFILAMAWLTLGLLLLLHEVQLAMKALRMRRSELPPEP